MFVSARSIRMLSPQSCSLHETRIPLCCVCPWSFTCLFTARSLAYCSHLGPSEYNASNVPIKKHRPQRRHFHMLHSHRYIIIPGNSRHKLGFSMKSYEVRLSRICPLIGYSHSRHFSHFTLISQGQKYYAKPSLVCVQSSDEASDRMFCGMPVLQADLPGGFNVSSGISITIKQM